MSALSGAKLSKNPCISKKKGVPLAANFIY